MRSTTILSAVIAAAGLAAAQTGARGDALVVTNNPIGASYVAKLPDRKDTKVRGAIAVHSGPGGKGVEFEVHIDGLPESGGPFLYHIHDQPVPADGNCTGTLAHLDPFVRGETPPCDASAPQTCQVGDLSGKHGVINATSFTARYTDDFAALVPGIGAFFGNRSIVVHFANKTRITCANWTALYKGSEPSGGYHHSSSAEAVPSTSYSASAAPTSSCSTLVTATPYSTNSPPPAVYTAGPTASSPSNYTVTTSSAPLAQTVNAAAGMVAPLPFAIAVAAAAFL